VDVSDFFSDIFSCEAFFDYEGVVAVFTGTFSDEFYDRVTDIWFKGYYLDGAGVSIGV